MSVYGCCSALASSRVSVQMRSCVKSTKASNAWLGQKHKSHKCVVGSKAQKLPNAWLCQKLKSLEALGPGQRLRAHLFKPNINGEFKITQAFPCAPACKSYSSSFVTDQPQICNERLQDSSFYQIPLIQSIPVYPNLDISQLQAILRPTHLQALLKNKKL